MLRAEVYTPDHAAAIQLRAADQAFVDGLGPMAIPIAMGLARHPGITLLAGAQVVACGGVVIIWPGVGEAWMRTSPLIERHPLAVLRLTKQFLASAVAGLKLRRLQCTVRKGYEPAIKWAERLGFSSEGVLRGFGPDGEDYIMFSRGNAWA